MKEFERSLEKTGRSMLRLVYLGIGFAVIAAPVIYFYFQAQ